MLPYIIFRAGNSLTKLFLASLKNWYLKWQAKYSSFFMGCYLHLMMLDPIKAGWLLKKYLFLLIDWPLLKFPLWGEIPGLRQTPICPKKIQSGSRWLNASNSNSLSYLQVYPPLTTSFLPPQAIQYIWVILNILHSFLHHQVKSYHKFLHLSSFSYTAVLVQAKTIFLLDFWIDFSWIFFLLLMLVFSMFFIKNVC